MDGLFRRGRGTSLCGITEELKDEPGLKVRGNNKNLEERENDLAFYVARYHPAPVQGIRKKQSFPRGKFFP
jgi:hypothetical protein